MVVGTQVVLGSLFAIICVYVAASFWEWITVSISAIDGATFRIFISFIFKFPPSTPSCEAVIKDQLAPPLSPFSVFPSPFASILELTLHVSRLIPSVFS